MSPTNSCNSEYIKHWDKIKEKPKTVTSVKSVILYFYFVSFPTIGKCFVPSECDVINQLSSTTNDQVTCWHLGCGGHGQRHTLRPGQNVENSGKSKRFCLM